MKNIKNKIISVLLLSFMLSALSCGEASQDGGKTDTSKPTGSNSAESATDAETTIPLNTDFDFKGTDFRIAELKTKTESSVTREEITGEVVNDAIYNRNTKVSELYNVNIKKYDIDAANTWDTLSSVTTSILAGDDAFDAALITGLQVGTFLSQPDMLVDFNNIGTMDIENSWWDKLIVERDALLGTCYALLGDISLDASTAVNAVYYSKQIAEDYKLDNFYDLVRSGKWTLDKFSEAIKKVTVDLNGDGEQKIEDDLNGFYSQADTLIDLTQSCGQSFSTLGSDKLSTLSINTPKTVDIIDKFTSLVNANNGIILQKVENDTFRSGSVWTSLKQAFAENRILFFFSDVSGANWFRDVNADFGLIPLPKYNEAQTEMYSPVSVSGASFLVVPATNTHLDMTGTVLDALGYYSEQLVTPALIDVTVTGKSLRDDDSAEMLELLFSTRTADPALYFQQWGWGKIFDSYRRICISGQSFSTYWAENESMITADMQKNI